ncbi:putative disease resistance protein [Camellia lanceoleosa]|uniref:Disease resistance protein n=1 Tax=Camellia lanceoleosa TaxID=1840588 RepID=A0ACC0IK63_9ERIC|nr:putative disease resistance protein [Camellia lanceoleosa]
MAETVALSVATLVVKKLGELLLKETLTLRGVRPQVEQLQAQLNRMECFLEAADARPKGGADEIIIRNCVAEIREASYDAEAAIATFVVKIAFRTSGRSGQFPFVLKRYLCIFKKCLALREARLEIKAINTRITNSLTTGFQTCGILNSTGVGSSSSSTSMAERQRQLRRSYTHIVEEDVVGTEEDVKAIVGLLKEKTHYRVVSIWGMGGLGKTTLAKIVYKDIEIRRHFDRVAWAYISQQCNTRDVLEGILLKLLFPSNPSKEERKEIGKLKHDELVKKLHEVQSKKKCLVILDDIWKDVDWDSLSPGFPNTTKVGSKILLTTRNENVAKHVDQQCVLYELRHLTEMESWELFTKKTFPRRKEGTANLRFLQTLDLRAYADEFIIEIPNVLWRLEQLRHLYLPCFIKLTGTSKLRLDGLSNLETLKWFDTECCDVRDFPKLTNLRKVEVGWVAPEDLAVILESPILLNNSNSILLRSLYFKIAGDFRTEEKQSLLRQVLGCHHLHKLILLGSMTLVNKLPDQFPPNLTKLNLEETKLEEDPMPTLEKLPNLMSLKLLGDSYIGKEMMEGSKDIQVVAAPLFLDVCYLAQSFHSCQLSPQPRSLLRAVLSLAWFAAFSCISSSHGEAYLTDSSQSTVSYEPGLN